MKYRPPAQFIAPVQEPYGYIIFRASEVKDLSVDEPLPAQSQHSVHDDPAVLGVHPSQAAPTPTPPPPPPLPPAVNQVPPTRRANPIHSAAASLETVERALGDLRVNGGGTNTTHTSRGGRRGHGGGPRSGRANEVEQIDVPATDFDFESSNAKFEKAARSPVPSKDDTAANGNTSGNNSEGPERETDQFGLAYNKSTSFFDSLSSSADALASGAGGGHNGGGRGRRGGGGGGGTTGRNRREEERERNVATFGEPGGVGLLGPGGYVGGWGGYGRRGGRPRRGNARGGGQSVPAQR